LKFSEIEIHENFYRGYQKGVFIHLPASKFDLEAKTLFLGSSGR
jgi:hypothetical protein